ncbi:tudor and KH domain-containing protein [Aplysia californica]|uniref:Tudor and KH domain-containing protein n=1 Tax=Aplysia californica TaxID=6500 RepID=A0ABM1ADZ9_APLCA|nr:tudor and KH domain-containing protein [Aplysia californica]
MPSVGVVGQVCAALLLPAGSLLLYWLYRRSAPSDEEVYGGQRVVTARNTVLEVCVPQRAVGAVIGRQGARIKEIQKSCGARVTFKDRGVGDGDGGSHRVAVIYGTLDAAHQAELLIQQVIAEVKEPITEQVDVPGYSLGRIIGKGGSSIREMCRVSGARINVDRYEGSADPRALRTVTLTGSQQQIDVALEMLEEKLEEEEKFRDKMSVMAANREGRSLPPQREPLKVTSVAVKETSWEEEEADAATLRQEKLPLTDGYVEVYVSGVEHPGHLWLQILGSKALHLETLQAELTAWVSTPEARTKFAVTSVTPGQLVAAQYEPDDPTFYRARVLGEVVGESVGESVGLLDLYFVDYGDNCLAPPSRVFQLRSDFQSFPFQAVECGLADVIPTGGESCEWEEGTVSVFEDLSQCARWKTLHARVVSHATRGQLLPLIELLDCSGEQTVNIGQELVRRGLAQRSQVSQSQDTQSQDTQSQDTQSQDTQSQDTHSDARGKS